MHDAFIWFPSLFACWNSEELMRRKRSTAQRAPRSSVWVCVLRANLYSLGVSEWSGNCVGCRTYNYNVKIWLESHDLRHVRHSWIESNIKKVLQKQNGFLQNAINRYSMHSAFSASTIIPYFNRYSYFIIFFKTCYKGFILMGAFSTAYSL